VQTSSFICGPLFVGVRTVSPGPSSPFGREGGSAYRANPRRVVARSPNSRLFLFTLGGTITSGVIGLELSPTTNTDLAKPMSYSPARFVGFGAARPWPFPAVSRMSPTPFPFKSRSWGACLIRALI